MGLRAAGYGPVFAVELNERIAACYTDNLGSHIRCADVRDVDYRPFAGVHHVHISAPCPSFSLGNKNRGEKTLDIELSAAAARCIREVRPITVTVENVRAYADSQSFREIRNAFIECGYQYDEHILDSSFYGVPQTRERFISRAILKPLRLPYLPKRQARTGWYAAVEDLLADCEDGTLAPWQDERLTEDYLRAFFEKREAQLDLGLFVEGASGGSRPPSLRTGDEPCTALTAGKGGREHRALLPHPNAKNDRFCMPDGDEPAFTITNHLNRCKAILLDGQDKSSGTQRIDDDPAFTMTNPNKNYPRALLLRVQGQNSVVTVGEDTPSPTVTTHDASKYRSLLLADQSGAAGTGVSLRMDKDPAQTITVGNGRRHYRAWIKQSRVKIFNTRCIARIQTFPDAYRFTGIKAVDNTIVGNAVPPELIHQIGIGLAIATKGGAG